MAGDKWHYMTPGPPPPGPYEGRPGEQTIAAKRPSTKKTATKKQTPPPPKSRWSNTRRVLGLVPWGALVACSFLCCGLIIFLVHAKPAADRSMKVLEKAQGDMSGLYPHRVRVFQGSWVVTAGLVGGCLLGCMFLAFARLRQKIAKQKGDKVRWSRFQYGLIINLGILSYIFIMLPTIWFTLNCVFLSAWGMGMYTLREAATIASINMQQTSLKEVRATGPVDSVDGVCPSLGCFNLWYYPWLDSKACLCTQPLVADMQGASRDAVFSVVWALGGVGCLWFGSLLAAAQGAADLALMRCVWHHPKPAPPSPKKSAEKSPSPGKRYPGEDYAYATPGTALPKRNLYVNGGFAAPPQGYYVASPQPPGYMMY